MSKKDGNQKQKIKIYSYMQTDTHPPIYGTVHPNNNKTNESGTRAQAPILRLTFVTTKGRNKIREKTFQFCSFHCTWVKKKFISEDEYYNSVLNLHKYL